MTSIECFAYIFTSLPPPEEAYCFSHKCLSVRLYVCLPVHHKSCPLYISKTVRDIFTKLGTNIYHDLIMCRKQELQRYVQYLQNYAPL